MTEEQALIPGLPDDIAFDCIARVPYRFHHSLRPVSRRWRGLLTSLSFRSRRETIGCAEDLIFLVQALGGGAKAMIGDSKDAGKATADLCPPTYALTIYSATDGSWHRVASPEPVPMFAQCAVVGRKLVLVGGWDPATLDPVADVQVLDLVTGGWRKGRPMSAARSFFACAAVGERVFVAGGHDAMKNALRTAEAYDVGSDAWAAIPAMAEERDECQGVALGGRFWAVSGYGTERQGMFSESAECYDPENGDWGIEHGIWSAEEGGASAACFAGGDALWCVGARGAREYAVGSGWRDGSPAPDGVKGSACAAAIGGGRVFMIAAAGDSGGGGGGGISGGAGSGGYGGWILETGCGKWRRIETPATFAGFAYSAAAVRI